jgi:hypothetical protein
MVAMPAFPAAEASYDVSPIATFMGYGTTQPGFFLNDSILRRSCQSSTS